MNKFKFLSKKKWKKDIDGFKTKETASSESKRRGPSPGRTVRYSGMLVSWILQLMTSSSSLNSSFRVMTTPRSCKGQLGPAHEGCYLFIYFSVLLNFSFSFSFIYLTVSQVSLYLSVSTSLSETKQREDLSWMKKWDMSFFKVICISYNYKYIYIYMCDICHMKN